ncbi:MAG TPA: endonuclease/exonuclease/phosphatase family protein [Herpetosiphonaceae bacterium]|nr:endonuclease/exonuclease/phosphatase family protein [Herpetosiphonaceae bacterium]
MTVIRVMSFNIFSPGDLEEGEELPAEEVPNSWEDRAPLNLRTIKRYSPDLIGFQEMEDKKLATYRDQLDEYAYAEPIHAGDAPTIFWRRDRCELSETGGFWLSRTPDERSNDWDVPYPLRVDWVRVRMRDTGAAILHLNTQFEDGPWGELSRVESSKLIVRRVAKLQESQPMPAVLTGDFNCNPWSEPYRILVDAGFTDTYRAAGHGDSADSSTFHGLRGQGYFALEWGHQLFWRVDWILTRDSTHRLQTTSCTLVRDAEPPIYPSDHFPVVTEVIVLR